MMSKCVVGSLPEAGSPLVAARLVILGLMLQTWSVAALAAPQSGSSPTSRCDLNNDGSVNVHDVQAEIQSALGDTPTVDSLHNYDLNADAGVNVVDIQIAIDGALKEGCSADSSPAVTGFSPGSGKVGDTVTLNVTGQGLYGAVLAIQSVDPIHSSGASSVTPISETGTAASFTAVLSREGPYNVIATNFVGASPAGQTSPFQILPANNDVDSHVSVLNTSFNPANVPTLPAGENGAAFYASVLNTAFNTANVPALPARENSAAFYASVLNAAFNTANVPTLPTGENSAAFYASVLNTSFNPANVPALPSGQNSVASLGLSVCNTDEGCVAITSAAITANAARVPAASHLQEPLRRAPARDSSPELQPLEERTSVTVGQTIRLTARNVDQGSAVEFDVNQTAIATVTEPPYETLFTVPDGPGELTFQVAVQNAGQTDHVSPLVRMTVLPDAGASVQGNIVERTGNRELSLAAGGLKAEFFHMPQPVVGLPSLDGLRPIRSTYVTAINQPNPRFIFGDDPLGAHLSPDYAVRFSGEVREEVSGRYRFWLAARSGAALLIDGKPLADSGFVSGEPGEAAVSVALARGWHSLEVIYYLAVGASSVRLEWQPPNGARREVLGPEYLRTVLAGTNTVSAADGEFAFPPVPTMFDSVWIRVRNGESFLEFPAVKPGASQVSIAVPK